MNILRFFRNIIHSGLDKVQNPYERRLLLNVNIANLLIFTGYAYFGSLYALAGSEIMLNAIVVNLIALIGFMTIPILNQKGYFHLSPIVLMMTTLITMFVNIAIYVGTSFYLHYHLLMFAYLPIVLFGYKRFGWVIFFTLSHLAVFILVEQQLISPSLPVETIDQSIKRLFGITTIFTMFSGTLACLLITEWNSLRSEQNLETIATTDPLTQLLNRRGFINEAEQELARSQRHDNPVTLFLLDLDHFKNINDTYGHPFGDKVLFKIAKFLEDQLRINDICARIGGEEFVVLLPDTDTIQAKQLAQRINTKIRDLSFSEYGNSVVRVTISIGMASFVNNETFYELYHRADEALYIAKKKGRDRVEFIENNILAIS